MAAPTRGEGQLLLSLAESQRLDPSLTKSVKDRSVNPSLMEQGHYNSLTFQIQAEQIRWDWCTWFQFACDDVRCVTVYGQRLRGTGECSHVTTGG